MDKVELEVKIQSIEVKTEQLRKDLAKAYEDLSLTCNEGVDKGVDTTYKIIHIKDPDYNIILIYEALGMAMAQSFQHSLAYKNLFPPKFRKMTLMSSMPLTSLPLALFSEALS